MVTGAIRQGSLLRPTIMSIIEIFKSTGSGVQHRRHVSTISTHIDTISRYNVSLAKHSKTCSKDINPSTIRGNPTTPPFPHFATQKIEIRKLVITGSPVQNNPKRRGRCIFPMVPHWAVPILPAKSAKCLSLPWKGLGAGSGRVSSGRCGSCGEYPF